jgi:RND superfamily putative drug exporter
MIGAVARAVSSRRGKWVVIGVWVALLAALGPPGLKLSEVTTDETATVASLPHNAQSVRLSETLKHRFPGGAALLSIAVYRREGGLTAADRAKIAADAAAIKRVKGVGQLLQPFEHTSPPGLVSRDRTSALVVVPLTLGKSDERAATVKAVRKITTRGSNGLQVRLTGAGALQSDLTTILETTGGALLVGTALLVLALLTAIYRSPLIALVPLIVVGVAYTIATGIIRLAAGAFNLTIDRTAVTLLAILMFGAGTDYCLLMVARYSTELRAQDDKHSAIASAVRRASPAIAASGLVVAGALCVLLAAQLNSNKVFGGVNALGVLVGLAASLTLLPAMLAVFGRRGFWPSSKLVAKREQARGPQLLPGLAELPDFRTREEDRHPSVRVREGIWRKVGTRALARPALTLLACVAVLAAGAVGLTKYQRDANEVGQFRKTTESTQGFKLLQKAFPAGALFPNIVLVDRSDGPLQGSDVSRAQDAMRAVSGVAAVSDVTNRSRDGRAATFAVTFADDPFKDPALKRAQVIRSRLAHLGVPGLTAIAGDGSAFRAEVANYTADDQHLIIPLVLLVITLTLVVLLRSVVAPLFLLVTVVLSFLAALGISLVVFDVVFHQPTVDGLLPIFAFVFLVALGVDYNIFFMHRVREEAREHGTVEGVLRALVATGPVITSAGIILAGTFALLMFLPLWILLELGFTVALGVLIDTFLVRTLMVPAIVKLVGDASWWPSRLRPPDAPPPGEPPRVLTPMLSRLPGRTGDRLP